MTKKLAPPPRPDLNTEKTRFISVAQLTGNSQKEEVEVEGISKLKVSLFVLGSFAVVTLGYISFTYNSKKAATVSVQPKPIKQYSGPIHLQNEPYQATQYPPETFAANEEASSQPETEEARAPASEEIYDMNSEEPYDDASEELARQQQRERDHQMMTLEVVPPEYPEE